ncbi:MAG: LysR family transcriptional regulator [Acidobacteriota bacterium]
MEFMQLEMFVTVVEEASVRKAAERVHRTQPAVSIALRKLEDEVGSPLFDRTNRQDTKLTPTGELLYEYAMRLLTIRREAFSSIEDLNSLRSGKLRIGANESISFYLLPNLTSQFQQNYPNVKLEIRCENSNSLLNDLHQRKLDVALLSHLPDGEAFDALPLMRDELVLITSPHHRLAKKEFVSIKELANESFIAEDVFSPWRKKFLDAFENSNTELNIIVDNAPIETIKKMVQMNLGIGFVPLMCVGEEIISGKLALLRLKDFQQERTIWAVQRKFAPHSYAAKAFMRVVQTLSDDSLEKAEMSQQKLKSLKSNTK